MDMHLLQTADSTLPSWARGVVNDQGIAISSKFVPHAWAPSFSAAPNCISRPPRLASANYPEQPSQALVDVLATDPNAAVQTWLSLYRARSRCTLDNHDLWASTCAFAAVADDLLRALDVHNADTRPNDKFRPSEAWEAILVAGLCDMCQEALNAPDFFDEFTVRLQGLRSVIDGCSSGA